ncbi:alpha/beta hydrolase [Comamonadaceae bacterium G21597-S1]|nr:alpha/beta hydrolase [Comamonadaceae bacterium G21597-S1]
MTSPAFVDPDHQPPMPFQAAEDYAVTVMTWAQEALPDDVVATPDLAYGADRLQRYDVYAPRGARNAPVLVFWHGGGWTNGYRDYVRFMAPHVTRLGMVLVAPSYRLTPAHRMPAPLDDCLSVLASLHRNVGAQGGAADRFYLSGHSAGGHLAAMAALRRDRWADAGVPANAIRGCLPISGIMDLYHPAPVPGSLEERVYTTVLANPDEDAVMSPLCWSVGNRMPFLLSHGERDSERVMRSNQRLFALLQLQHGPVRRVVRAGRDHFQTHSDLRQADHPWYADLRHMVATGKP